MFKAGKVLLIVDSVEVATKFYTEKMGFDISALSIHENKEKREKELKYVLLNKGKFFISFRLPNVEELADFSFIKRCSSRCTGVFVEMKKGLEKYFQRCKKRSITILQEPQDTSWGYRTFSIKDPFGFQLTIAQPIENFVPSDKEFCGQPIKTMDQSGQSKKEAVLVDEMSKYLKTFGILRRAAKKYSKSWIKKRLKR